MRLRGKFVEELGVIFRRCWLGMGLILCHAIENHDAVAQMDVVAGNTDQPLY